ncbi:uncharacterized protein N0V89_007373 [Didymosphaeria variabile]|uniref:Tim17-domain-containing protein n=1 Tax=Didymosphaeria variabile TaxID=1932322 RepID=A0A9W8XJD8_9PLEO|nr:uncharacterized protein N0V89_007373 [Didymosphaeria variabile]KAJ4352027.1 hypothetical protein N0V89_007373 [Didymosphaeria variabile]
MATAQLDSDSAQSPNDAITSESSTARPLATLSPERLGMPFDRRLLLATFTSFSCGSMLGYLNTSRLASLRFRAENAHRLPISQPGWYLYHKSKNYYKLKHGITAGLRSGVFLAAWTSIFFVVEESLDVFRGTWRAGRTIGEMEGVSELDIDKVNTGVEKSRDFLSSVVAGMVTGGLWSAWNKFPVLTAARTIRMGLFAGLGYGVAQDALTWARGKTGGVVNDAESWIYRGAKNRRQADDNSTELEQKEQEKQE